MNRALVVVALGWAAASAHADPTPWSQGVPKAAQDQANKLFDEGNALFAAQAHAPALDKYRAAIAIWDHPLIRFNLAVTLIRLERPLDAADELERALRYGAQPFTPELYRQALDYQILLRGRVGTIDASCRQPGATLVLDGKPWFTCPGTRQLRVLAGEHTLVGELADHVPSARRIVVPGGAAVTETVELVRLDRAVRLEYPYRRWIPYTIGGTGATVALGGLVVWFAGRSQLQSYRENLATTCSMGCQPGLADQPLLRDQRDAAQLKGTVGLTMMIAGGAVTAGGIVLAILNRPRRVLPELELAPTAGGITASTQWHF